MLTKFYLPLLAVVLAGSLNAAKITFQVIPLGGNSFHYDYEISGMTFLTDEQIDIIFDGSLYGTLSNATAGTGFSVFLLPTNNPPGTSGDYLAEALVDNPPLTGPFGVDFVFTGTGEPGPQPFAIYQLDQDGNIIGVVQSGVTEEQSASVPEPVTFLPVALVVAVGVSLLGAARFRRRPQVGR